MVFTPGKLSGVVHISLDPRSDDRGTFLRSYSHKEFLAGGITFTIAEINQATSLQAGILRGLHWQVEPNAQSKVFQCTQGQLYDFIADVRPGSPTFGQWEAVTLTAGDGQLLYIPPGIAHGYLTLSADSTLCYAVSGYWSPADERGLRYDDPLFAISLPIPPAIISAKDSAWPDFKN